MQWAQIDEPILALDLPQAWRDAFKQVYAALSSSPLKLLVATYFDGLKDNLPTALALPVAGLHVDLVRAPEQLAEVVAGLRADQVLSAGVINGRNIWRTDLDAAAAMLAPIKAAGRAPVAGAVVLAAACACGPGHETELDAELKSWLSFAAQKLQELNLLGRALDGATDAATQDALGRQRARWPRAVPRPASTTRPWPPAWPPPVACRATAPLRRPYRAPAEELGLPAYPTTTIGSFPQTAEIRALRRDWKSGALTDSAYETAIRKEIEEVIRFQEKVGLDVLVHGEPERNDMVEYFGELLAGFAFTRNGWVQSYGSRCVKPPVIFGDVARPAPMTVGWSSYAQSLTDKPVKGMLTGPVTILQWSFVRDDQPREQTCRQLALALRDEVVDLEAAGISVIQIDEPAIREGLPLRRADWQAYLDWAVDCFRLSTAGVRDETQIHTHMCYSEFNDIIESIAAMDADVITIETSRSNMELLKAFEDFRYPNDIGPGVYDIHSPNVPEVDWMVGLMQKAAAPLPKERLWVNPDCGLKTRAWPETEAALIGMVQAARALRDAA